MNKTFLSVIVLTFIISVTIFAADGSKGVSKSPVKAYTKINESAKQDHNSDAKTVKTPRQVVQETSGQVTFHYVVKNYQASYLAESVSLMLSNSGIIQSNDDLNVIIITDDEDRVDEIQKMLKEVDILPQQVTIHAKVLKVNDSLAKDNGINVGQALKYSNIRESITREFRDAEGHDSSDQYRMDEDIDYGNQDESQLNTTTESRNIDEYMNKTGGLSFDAALTNIINYLVTNGYAKIVSEPKIVTINNKKGKVFIGDRVKIVNNYSVNNLGGNISTGSNDGYMEEEAGLVLEVTPHIGSGNYITLDIRTGFGDINNYGASYVKSNINEAESSVIVKSGEPIVIGGYKSQDKTVTKYSVPVLGSVPLLKNIFSKKQTSTSDVEMVIILIPEIVSSGTGFKNEENTKME